MDPQWSDAMADDNVTVIRADGEGGSGAALAVLFGLIALIAALYLVFGTNIFSGTQKIDADVKIETPK
jgi:hypothetical protein